MTNSHSAVIDAVLDMAQDALENAGYADTVFRGPTTTGNCISAEPSYGTADHRFFSKDGTFIVTLVFNAKHENMKTALNKLEQVILYLTRAETYPSDESWQITKVMTNALPMMIGREEDNTWLYAASVYIEYFVRGD